MMSREEHLKWAKARALEYVEARDLQNAVASMASDLGKHPQTAGNDFAVAMGAMLLVGGAGQGEIRNWINGFN